MIKLDILNEQNAIDDLIVDFAGWYVTSSYTIKQYDEAMAEYNRIHGTHLTREIIANS